MAIKLNAKQLRVSNSRSAQNDQKTVKRNSLVLVLDNVYDTFNIGSFFRLADALACESIYLCGQVVTPPNIKIHRASIGTWKWVPWSHGYDTAKVLKKLIKDGYTIYSCEQNNKSIDYRKVNYHGKIALVLGNETTGVSSEAISLSNNCIEIPMYGVNRSLNVLVAGSVIAYHIVQSIL